MGQCQTGRLVYGGYSAGSCKPLYLEGIHLIDDPEVIPDGYSEKNRSADPPARALADQLLRWRSEHPESADAEKAVDYLRQSGLEFRTLRDGEALIVANGESRVA